jgi:diguanylate cyclase
MRSHVDESTSMSRHLPDRMAHALTAGLILVTGSTISAMVVWGDVRLEPQVVQWPVFAMMSALLIGGEVSARCWIRTGSTRPVTALWLFAYALLLLGPAALALTVALLGSLLGSLIRREPTWATLSRLANVGISLGVAALLLSSWGTIGAIAERSGVSWRWVFEAGVGGVTILLLNTFVVAVHDAVSQRTALTTTLRRGLGARITAEGAMLSLAPLWVVGLDFSLALIPLLATTTLLVFRSTRQALERAFEAHHDPLTGLANRRAFRERVNETFGGFGAGTSGLVLLMDLDGFKEINDQLGHELGDGLLVAFADRLTASLPRTAVAARLGGDEFAVLLPLDHPRGGLDHDATHHLDALRARLFEPLLVQGFPVSVTASIGVAFAPRHGRTPSELLRAADVAMYKAKRLGTALEYYDDCVQLPRRGRVGLLSELGNALTDHQFRVHFQPQLRMSNGGVDTVEALIRWQHPVHGTIPPGEFIGLAEQTDLIGPITEMVLRMSSFGLLASSAGTVRLAVNVSSRSLHDRYFAPLVFTILAETGFPPNRLELEVTERALVTNPERSAYTIERLREAGVSIAIDDFGTGYSSFETLRQLDVDRVKIDAAFVTALLDQSRDRAIVEAVIELSHRLGLEVVAEGVESTQVWDILRTMGCDVAQGYGIAHPMALPELKGWLTAWNEIRIEQAVRTSPASEHSIWKQTVRTMR